MNKNENDTMSGRRTLDGVGAGARPEWTGTMSGRTTAGGEEGVVLAGRYRVVRRLGEGGMGSVWLAEDLKLDGKSFAIKMLPAVLAGKKGAYRQVKVEALMAMKLAHPNIAIVRAFEEDEGGNPFLVMDYIDGEPLDDILAERGPLSEEETLRILGPVAAALDYAHSQGVVHRDVKPGNVMVRKDGTPFVLDFGIAREIQETMTRVTGKLSSGTLLYMSPEQLKGRAPTAAQDVYSFAAMAYECLAGHPPFFRGAIEDQIKNETPEELPAVVGEVLRRGVMAGLAKEAEARPGHCAEVLRGAVKEKNRKIRVVAGGRRWEDAKSPRVPMEKKKTAGWGWIAALLLALGIGAGVWQLMPENAGEPPPLQEEIPEGPTIAVVPEKSAEADSAQKERGLDNPVMPSAVEFSPAQEEIPTGPTIAVVPDKSAEAEPVQEERGLEKPVPPPAAEPSPISDNPYIGAIVVDAATGEVLREDRSGRPGYPASMTKLMTLFVTLDAVNDGRVSLSDNVSVSASASSIGGAQVFLAPTESFPLDELLYAMMVRSANDAAYLVAEHVAGSVTAFVRLMNEKARALKLSPVTVFVSPHGLPPSGTSRPDMTTAADFAKLCVALVREHPEALTYTSTSRRTFPSRRTFRSGGRMPMEMENPNPLLGTFSGCDGLQTGYFKRAGYSIAATAERNGCRTIAVILGSDSKTTRNEQARSWLEFGLSQARIKQSEKFGAK